MNLQGAKPEVSALCTDDNIYERELQFHLFSSDLYVTICMV